MDIKVLGPGCPKCHTLEKNTREAVKELGLEAEVSKVTGGRWRGQAYGEGGDKNPD
jgi:hydrogenase maturation factor